jgi:cytochrome c-type biogenesis protein CcmH
MTPFLLLTFVMVVASVTWMTRPLWHRATMVADAGVNAILHPRRSMRMAACVALFVVTVVGVGYALVGTPSLLDTGPAPMSILPGSKVPEALNGSGANSSGDGRAEASATPQGDDSLSQAESRVSAMVDSLAQRLKTRPDDAEGWQLLGRSYAALGRHTQAVSAFKTALRLRPDNATLLAEYAFSAAVLDPRGVNGEPARLTARALQLDPRNPKALALAGTLALDRKDYQAAIQYWEQLAQIEPANTPMGKQVQASIMQARQLAGTQATLMPVTAMPPSSITAGATRAQVSGTVTLSPALLASAAPDDTVFIYARAAGGPRMPLAVLRKQVRDLPVRFTLDDSLAMSPSSKLSGVSSVVVGARVSHGGNAMARDGDLQGQLAEVPVGSSDLKVVIAEVVHMR